MKILTLFASVGIIALSGNSALGATFSLAGSELKLRTIAQSTPSSQLFTTSFSASAIVSKSEIEFPDVESLFDPTSPVPLGFARSLVDVSIDAGEDYLTIDFDNAGFGLFATGFQNTYVFKFDAPTALQITDVAIDLSTTLSLTPSRVTFYKNELFVNVQSLRFDPNSFARINLGGILTPDSGATSIPEPGSILGLGMVALAGTLLKRHTKLKAL
ncbi:MAG: PEP-CTERM sorting domain-containing protein [Leptolyngbyaceae cyanobacterium SM1_1_3]|nr:PEP-CTERM sorting domain-containing protein [Leptolyngbyaceae cyanobacterium SM1_1_3]NJN04279.1 PEP-CTERM sorting domain-containing protein [Leptolyngbyaceae cyanobacterium RM1_1_2]NJO08504.1 PEP-CTERM sorting domain-containing protein [Leptolyngbyaceae cyanobacterium SL_1_1]